MLLIASVYISSVNAMTSTNYQIQWDSINSGGTDFSSSTNYSLHDTVGEQATGYSSSTNYTVHAGYRQTSGVVIPTLSFSLGAQENITKTTYTSISTSTNTVVLSSVASFSTGSFIGIVQDEGLAQSLIVGEIINITGLTVTVDKWDGMVLNITSPPTGGDDFAYRMDGHSIPFGALTSGIPKTGAVRTDISTNAANGYTLRIQSDGYLRTSSSSHIMDVSDGAVTVNAEEYGASTHGPSATSTGYDFAVSSTLREIQHSNTVADRDRIGMIYKVSITPTTPAGNYSQTVRYLLTANY